MRGIKIARVTLDLNQSELAKLVGVSLTTVSGWEIGRIKPNLDNLMKLSEVLEVSIDELIKK